jgi:hypothetical protein
MAFGVHAQFLRFLCGSRRTLPFLYFLQFFSILLHSRVLIGFPLLSFTSGE